jgi:hypothetical protein
MIAACPEPVAEALVKHAQSKGIAAWRAGDLEDGSSPTASPEVIWE